MTAVSVGSRSGSRVLGRELWCCAECYTAQHYGAESVVDPEEWTVDAVYWDRDSYSEAVNSLAECGSELSDWTCPEHDPTEDPESGELCECVYCGSADLETGRRWFSRSACELCGSDLAGERFRFAVWEAAD